MTTKEEKLEILRLSDVPLQEDRISPESPHLHTNNPTEPACYTWSDKWMRSSAMQMYCKQTTSCVF